MRQTAMDVADTVLGIYGSEGWGFESLRARNTINAVTSGTPGAAFFVQIFGDRFPGM
jgi:hypothetical protein